MGIPRLPNESSGTSRVPRHGPHIRTKPRHGHHHTNPRIVPRSRQRQKSISGYVFILAGSPISWQAKKQTTVAQSTVEAEYAAKEVTWLQYLLRDLGISKNEPKILHCDNQGAISLAKNPMHHAKTKPVDMQLYLIWDHVDKETINIEYWPTDDMLDLDKRTHSLTSWTVVGINRKGDLPGYGTNFIWDSAKGWATHDPQVEVFNYVASASWQLANELASDAAIKLTAGKVVYMGILRCNCLFK